MRRSKVLAKNLPHVAKPRKPKVKVYSQGRPLDQVVKPGMADARYMPFVDKDTLKVLPSLIEAVESLLLWGARNQEIVRRLTAKPYLASSATINRCMREVRDEWLAELAKTRQQRVAKNRRRLERIVEKAYKGRDLRLSKDAIMDMSKLTGDLAPDVHLVLNSEQDPEDLLKKADELRALALVKDPD